MNSVPDASVPAYGRKNPFLARLTHQRSLTLPGSSKDTRHFEIDLSGSGLSYHPGNSLGVFARNRVALVDAVIQALGFLPDAAVTLATGTSVSFHDALLRHFALNRASRKMLHGVLDRLPSGEAHQRVEALLASDPAVADYLFSRDYLDLLQEFPSARFESPEAFLKMLSPIQPRLYSIASSLDVHPNSVHLCVGVVRYEAHGRQRSGLATGYLADEVVLGRPEIPVFVQESPKFFLPPDSSRDIIMVGPGTGIAPFRAFLEQRAFEGAKGRHWLFFGEQHRATDFLYESELEKFRRDGVLQRLDVAFSRDQSEKIYVQNRMLENGAEIWRWIQGGAYFYVCGDARRMAKDVHHALIQIVQTHGSMDLDAATAYVDETMNHPERRYLKDVY